jgi:hypothetical protein
MSSIILDTKELQQRLLAWGANADGIINPETSMPSGVVNEATIRALVSIGYFFDIPGTQINVASQLGGIKAIVQPAELVQKILAAPPIPLPEKLVIQFSDQSRTNIAKRFPPTIKGNTELIAKRVAANVARAQSYAKQISEIAKRGAPTGLMTAYRNWYKSATELQKTLAKRLRSPAAYRAMQKKLEAEGVDSVAMIAALEKGPLALAALESKSTGLEAFPFIFIAIAAITGTGIWKGSDILSAWKDVKKEDTNRAILDATLKCIADGNCDASKIDDVMKHREAVTMLDAPWWWMLGGAVAAGLGVFMWNKRSA